MISAIAAMSLLVTAAPAARADTFERSYGLRPGAVIIDGGGEAAFREAMRAVEDSGARGIISFSRSLIFARFPLDFSRIDLAGVDARLALSADDLDPASTDLVTLRIARGLFESRRILQRTPPAPPAPFDDVLLRVPPEIAERTQVEGPRRGAPSSMIDRAIDQNSEFLIGRVFVNVILPESIEGGERAEDWTEQEIADMLMDVHLGLDQYLQASHWVELGFHVECPEAHRKVPVQYGDIHDPILGSMGTDWMWVLETMEYLGVDPDRYGSVLEMVHRYNESKRQESGFDWVFTAFVVDASLNECWQGPGGNYVAYSYLGGPYIVVPYPACRFGAGIHFGHVFIHEMSHTFWALDEYASAEASCNQRSGYLNYRNGNSYYNNCGEGMPCIMNNANLEEPLPICRYTMGQVGLADDNVNSIADLYEVYPQVEFPFSGMISDTTYNGEVFINVHIWNEARESQNYAIPAQRRISYAPKLVKGQMRINNGLWDDVEPAGGSWDSADETIGMIMADGVGPQESGRLEPGDNWIHFRFENMVGLSARDSMKVTYIGIRYYENSLIVDPGVIEVKWKTAEQVFGARFDIYRRDVTARMPMEMLATVEGEDFYESSGTRRVYRYRDETIVAGHEYVYRIAGVMEVDTGEGTEEMVYSSRDMTETAVIPVAGNLVSTLVPNPTDSRGTKFSIRVPRSYRDVTGGSVSGIYPAPSLIEIKTPVEVEVYDVAGRKIRDIYSMSVYGGDDITLQWDGSDSNGSSVAPGVYFLRVRAGGSEQVRKVVIIR